MVLCIELWCCWWTLLLLCKCDLSSSSFLFTSFLFHTASDNPTILLNIMTVLDQNCIVHWKPTSLALCILWGRISDIYWKIHSYLTLTYASFSLLRSGSSLWSRNSCCYDRPFIVPNLAYNLPTKPQTIGDLLESWYYIVAAKNSISISIFASIKLPRYFEMLWLDDK